MLGEEGFDGTTALSNISTAPAFITLSISSGATSMNAFAIIIASTGSSLLIVIFITSVLLTEVPENIFRICAGV